MSTTINISSYIASLDETVRSELYASPWTCQALFRALAPLAQQYIVRLLYVEKPIAEGEARCGCASRATRLRIARHAAVLKSAH